MLSAPMGTKSPQTWPYGRSLCLQLYWGLKVLKQDLMPSLYQAQLAIEWP